MEVRNGEIRCAEVRPHEFRPVEDFPNKNLTAKVRLIKVCPLEVRLVLKANKGYFSSTQSIMRQIKLS